MVDARHGVGARELEPASQAGRGLVLSRRTFLAWSGLATTAAVLTACSPVPSRSPKPLVPSPSPSLPPPPSTYFDALAELRDALRTSPDHLVAEVRRVVAERDPEAILRFVRETIATYPAGRRSLGDLVRGRRWGTRATLRGGAGTPREKADLLADLYAQAGFAAEVVRRDVEGIDGEALLRRQPRREFVPTLDPGRLELLRTVLGIGAVAEPVEPLDVDGADSRALAAAVLTALGGAPAVRDPFEREAIRALPAVSVTTPDGTFIADPFGSDGLQAVTGRTPSSAPAADELLEVRVAIEAARASAPAERFTLVEGAWTAEDVVGRALMVEFVPPAESLEELLVLRPREVQAFLPILAVRSNDLTLEESRALSVVGPAVTLGGDVIDVDAADGVVRVGGEMVATPDPDPVRLAAVRSIEVTANAAGFPTVGLLVRVVDGAGEPVEGLPATAFAVAEDGTGVGFLLEHAVAPAPRVLLLLDDSSSLPDDFRDAGAGVVARQMAERLLSVDPRVLLRVAVVDGVEAEPVGDWTSDPAAVEAAARRASGLGSQLWEALSDASKLGPTAIVFVTDGAATDGNDEIAQPPPGMAARVRVGPPAVVIGVGAVRPEMLEQLGDAGGLGSFTVAAQDEAVEAVVAALDAHRAASYRFRYQAPNGGPTARTVEVALREAPGIQRIAGTATYEVPTEDDRASPPALSGLFLRVRVGTLETERTIAGLATDEGRAVASPDDVAAVRRAMFGSAVLEFEAAAPPPSVLLDDLFSALLSTRALLETGDQAGKLAALAAGPLFLPNTYGALTFALPGEGVEPLTFETGLRVTLHRAVEARAGDGRAIRRTSVDLLPQTRFATADVDPASAFRRTAERTARMAVIEGRAFPTSTVALLANEPLVPIGLSLFSTLDNVEPRLVELLAAAVAPWAPIRAMGLVPADGAPAAAWLLDPETGSMWGVLGDGSGGGSEEADINETFDSAERALAGVGVAGDLAALAGIGGFSLAFGVWAQLEATKLKKLRAATLMLATLRPPQGDIADLSNLACGLAQTLAFDRAGAIAGGLFGSGGRTVVTIGSLADGASSVATGSGLIC